MVARIEVTQPDKTGDIEFCDLDLNAAAAEPTARTVSPHPLGGPRSFGWRWYLDRVCGWLVRLFVIH